MDHKKEEVQDTKESERLAIREEEKRENHKEKRNLNQRGEGKSEPQKDSVREVDQGKILDLMV
jgi:hypothetical protein